MFVLFERIVNFPASLSEAEVRRSISDAFHVWSDVSRLSFHELTTGNADISIEFLTGFHGDGYPFDGPGKLLSPQVKIHCEVIHIRPTGWLKNISC